MQVLQTIKCSVNTHQQPSASDQVARSMRSVSRLVTRLASAHLLTRGFAVDSAQQAQVVRKQGWSTWSKLALVTPPVLVAGWIGLSDEPQRRATVVYNVPLRVCRDAVAVLSIAAGIPQSCKALPADLLWTATSAILVCSSTSTAVDCCRLQVFTEGSGWGRLYKSSQRVP